MIQKRLHRLLGRFVWQRYPLVLIAVRLPPSLGEVERIVKLLVQIEVCLERRPRKVQRGGRFCSGGGSGDGGTTGRQSWARGRGLEKNWHIGTDIK